jgi:hypothetical protein
MAHGCGGQDVIEQKADHIHNNQFMADFVTEPQYWKYSSAIFVSAGRLADLSLPIKCGG